MVRVMVVLSAAFPSMTLVATLSAEDKQALACIEDGRLPPLSAARRAGAGAPHYQLAARTHAGERVLRQLGLVPETPLPRRGLTLLRSGAAKRAVLVFNGIAARFSLSRLLIMEMATHIVLMKDPGQCFGLLGIPELGADYQACIWNLRCILAALKVDEVYCIGFSAGGAPAIRFGCDLGVRGILGFSIPTTLDLRNDPGADISRYPQLVRLYRRARHLGTDLAADYAKQPVRPSMILVHSRRHVRDAWLAGRMAGIAGVTLLDTAGYDGHDTHHWCVRTGLGRTLLDRLFMLAPVSA